MTGNLTANHAPVLIRANAGTGKTFSLSNRYISLLAQGHSCESVLATTFTRKAAGEIQERVFQRLAKAALSEQEAELLGEFINNPAFTSKKALAILQTLVCNQHRINICTLDSFCVRVARSFGLELGLEPNWSILDEAKLKALKQEAIGLVCRNIESKEFTNILNLLGRGDSYRAVHKQIENQITDLHELYLETDQAQWNWLKAPKSLTAQELQSQVQALEALPLACKANSQEPRKTWLKAHTKALNAAQAGDWLSFVSGGIAANIAQGKELFDRAPIPKEVSSVYQALIRHSAAIILNKYIGQTRATYQILQVYDEAFEKCKSAKHSLLFNDIKNKLAKASIMGNLDEVYYRLDARIKHLLLDEFQDTSRSEWLVLYPMLEETLSKAKDEYSFFCVGDVKQAIYGWRGGIAEIFDSLEKRWPQIESETLDKSYRSSPFVIDFANKIFQQISENPALETAKEAALTWQKGFIFHKTAKGDWPGQVSVRSVDSNAAGEQLSTFETAANLIKDLSTQAPEATIGVLFRKNNSVAKMLYELSKPEIGILASGEGGNLLTDSPAVTLILSLLRLIDHPGDTIAAYHVASSPLGSSLGFIDYTEQRRRLEIGRRLRESISKNGYGVVLADLAKSLAKSCTVRDAHRLMQLVELAHIFEKHVDNRVMNFVDFIMTKKVEDPSAAKVRVMTIHKSKGLEFDVVVLPELEEPFVGNVHAKILNWRPSPMDSPQRVFCMLPEKLRALEQKLVDMHEQGKVAKIKEELSVFYVALTRAKYAVQMILDVKTREKKIPMNPAGVLRYALGIEGVLETNKILYKSGNDTWTKLFNKENFSAKEKRSSVPELRPDLASAKSKRRRALLRRSPSTLEGGNMVDLRNTLKLTKADAAMRGSLFHAFFEEVAWLDDGQPEKQKLLDIAAKFNFQNSLAASYVSEFYEILDNCEISKCLKREAYSHLSYDALNVYREYPFAYRKEDAVLIGVFDRLVVGRNQGRIVYVEILDFKTDAIKANESKLLQQKTDYYSPQIEAYKEAIVATMHIPYESVEAKLLFLSLRQVINV